MKFTANIDEYLEDTDPWNYATHPSDKSRADWFIAFTQHLSKERTLEIGPGIGFIAKLIKTREYVGVDVSSTSTKILNELFREQGVQESHKGICGNVLELEKLSLGIFDFIVAIDVFYKTYLGDNVKLLEKQLKKVTYPGSVLITDHIVEFPNLVPTTQYVELDRWIYPYRETTRELIVQKRVL